MRALITGVAGQDGTLLSKALVDKGWDVFGSRLANENLVPEHSLTSEKLIELDVTDSQLVTKVIGEIKPNVIFHFAGITSVGFSIEQPEITRAVNVGGTQNILDAISAHGLLETQIIHAASTEIFDKSQGLITENSPLDPASPYAESKALAYELCREHRRQGLKVTNAILSNHESYLRPETFVTGKISNGVAQISLDLKSKISLGNTDVEKDWSAASDIIDGLIRIAEKDFVGDVILASGISTNLQDLISTAFLHVGISDWQNYIETDQSLVRKNEGKSIRIDPARAFELLGWKASTPMSTWVGKMVDFHLNALGKSQPI